MSENKKWSGKTGGRKWMQKWLVSLFSVIDIRIAYFLMAWVAPFYMVFHHKAYVAMYRFFRECFGKNPVKAFWFVYLNHLEFGKVILDRFAVYAGKHFDFEVEGYTSFSELISREEGFILLSSHIGNYELAGYSFLSKKKKINALVFSGETETVMRNRKAVFSDHGVEMIEVRDDLSHVFRINEALLKGEIVSMPGDRFIGSSKSLDCDFFGRKAVFPQGPFITAVQRQTPVIAMFVMKEKAKVYRIIIRRLDFDSVYAEGSRQQQLAGLVRNYAAGIEEVLRRYPTQWYNYYDFWK